VIWERLDFSLLNNASFRQRGRAPSMVSNFRMYFRINALTRGLKLLPVDLLLRTLAEIGP